MKGSILHKRISILKVFYLTVVFLFSVSLSIAQPPPTVEPCTPDCSTDVFTGPYSHTMTYTCNDYLTTCGVTIEFYVRLACGTWYDVQITKIKFQPQCLTQLGCTDTDAEVLDKVTKQFLRENPMGFPAPNYPAPICVDRWRVTQGSCWRRYIDNVTPSEGNEGGGSYGLTGTTYFIPCPSSQCCLTRYQVCRNATPPYDITVTEMGGPTPPTCTVGCTPYCGNGSRRERVQENEKTENKAHYFSHMSIAPNPTSSSTININYTAHFNGKLTVKLIDLQGNELIKTQFEASADQESSTMLNVNSVPNGKYFIYILNEGEIISQSEVTITR